MRILIVEEPGSRHQAVADLLRGRGHEVHHCEEAETARAFYEREQPDLVMLAGVKTENLVLCRWIRKTEQGEGVIIVAIVKAETNEDLQAIIETEVDDCFFGAANQAYLEAWLALIERRTRIRARRRQTEKALLESEARTRAILKTTVDGIITIDEQGHIESFNPAAEKIFGYTAEEVIGKNVTVLMPSPYREEHDSYIWNYLETGHRKIIGIGREVVGQHKDGTIFPIDLAVSELRLGDRRLFTGVVRDITERRRLEQEILRISAQERRRFGQDLHDGLGQMLTGIGLISQNLVRTLRAQDQPGADEAADEAAEVTALIKEADQHARTLARGLIPVDLEAKGLSSALHRLAHNAERLFDIRCTVEEVGSVLIHDNTVATHLFRIAQEAVSNAVKHGQAQHVKISLAAGNGRWRLRIQDDGVGFPDELDENESGMGVRIMHYRARIIGATLETARGLNFGTTITCTFRRTDEPIHRAEPT